MGERVRLGDTSEASSAQPLPEHIQDLPPSYQFVRFGPASSTKVFERTVDLYSTIGRLGFRRSEEGGDAMTLIIHVPFAGSIFTGLCIDM